MDIQVSTHRLVFRSTQAVVVLGGVSETCDKRRTVLASTAAVVTVFDGDWPSSTGVRRPAVYTVVETALRAAWLPRWLSIPTLIAAVSRDRARCKYRQPSSELIDANNPSIPPRNVAVLKCKVLHASAD